MNEGLISLQDLFLVPVYFLFFLIIAVLIKRKHKHNLLYKKYFVKGFIFTGLCAVLYGMLMHFYYGFGDTITYFKDGIAFKDILNDGRENIDFFFKNYQYGVNSYNLIGGGAEGGWLVIKISALLSYFAFSRFLVVSLIFSFFAYLGTWKLFLTFCDFLPEQASKFSFCVLFFPSAHLFASGILKDTICFACLSWLIYVSYQLFILKQKKLRYPFIIIFCIIVISVVKVYIIACFIPSFVIYLILVLIKGINNKFLRVVTFPLILLIVSGLYYLNAKKIDEALGSYAVESIFDRVKEEQDMFLDAKGADEGAVFSLGTYDPTFIGLVEKLPAGLVATLFRPFIWEVKKPIMLLHALENAVILFFTLYVFLKAGLLGFFRKVSTSPFLFMCFSFAIIFGALVGLSTLNFGTLIRYRIPCMPIYVASLVIILYSKKKVTAVESLSGNHP